MMPNRDGSTRFVLIRHAETVGNQQGVWTGWSETPLNETGWEQLRRTAGRLERDPLDAVALYTSPIGRAQQTADSIGQAVGLRPIPDESLKEMHFGELELIRGEHLATDHPQIYARWRDRTDETFGWPGGESRREFRARTVDALERLGAAHRGDTILLVTHSGFIRMALAHFVPERFMEWWQVRLDNCGLTHLVMDPAGQAQVSVFNDVSHLLDPPQGRGASLAPGGVPFNDRNVRPMSNATSTASHDDIGVNGS
jgi:probable phosphoglycerate mutase